MTNLRQAAQQEPVAAQEKSCRTCSHRNPSLKVQGNQGACGGCFFYSHYNCATPPAAQRTWVGLEPEEILDLFDRNNVYGSKWIEFARTVEAKLKAKNV
jgi:hypothetical protein